MTLLLLHKDVEFIFPSLMLELAMWLVLTKECSRNYIVQLWSLGFKRPCIFDSCSLGSQMLYKEVWNTLLEIHAPANSHHQHLDMWVKITRPLSPGQACSRLLHSHKWIQARPAEGSPSQTQPRQLYSIFTYVNVYTKLKWKEKNDEYKIQDKFPGGPVVKTMHFHCKGHRFDLWSGN